MLVSHFLLRLIDTYAEGPSLLVNLEQFLFYMLFGMTVVKMGGEKDLGRMGYECFR